MSVDRLERLKSIATVFGGFLLPIAIFGGEALTGWRAERENRKVGIAQIVADQADQPCPERLNTTRLITQLFSKNLSKTDLAVIIQYLRICDSDAEDAAVQAEVQAEIEQLEALIISPENSPSLPEAVENSGDENSDAENSGDENSGDENSDAENSGNIDDLSVELLSDYKIEIFHLSGIREERDEAEAIAERLRNLELEMVTVRAITEEDFSDLGGLSDDQIRYEPDREIQEAVALQRLINSDATLGDRQFRLQTIQGRTGNYISILLKYNEQPNDE